MLRGKEEASGSQAPFAGAPGCRLSHVPLFATLWTAARRAPLSMGLSRQEYWSELPFPPPRDLPNPEIEPRSPVLAGRFFTTEPPGKPSKKYKEL